ncbi:MAG: DUF7504 family protein, partial [Methanoculleaceae archaeon]
IEIIRQARGDGWTVVVLTTSTPYSILKKDYEKAGIPTDGIYFIDTVTRYAMGSEPAGAANCYFVSNPGNLTEMGIAVTGTLKKIDGDQVSILLDSVNSMLIYISSKNLIKFIHFVVSKLRIMEFSGFFLVVEKGIDPSVLVQLESLVDEVIDQ